MKICTKCGISKNLFEFYSQIRGKDGVKASCKKCDTASNRKRTIERNINIPKKVRMLHGVSTNDPSYKASVHLKYAYGITIQTYNELLILQNNRCKVCKDPPEVMGKRFDVDHCHKTGKIRGLLCNSCNTGLGKFKDSKELLAEAIIYLQQNE